MTDTTIDYDLLTIQQAAACGYQARQRAGKGSYGFVYEVGDKYNNLFAFKYILPDKNYKLYGLDDLIEIDILTRINHPYIIHASKIVTSRNCEIDGLAIVLPLADRTLHDIIRDRNLTTDYKLPIIYKLALALKFMHQHNILHLDIKSANVVLQGLKENIPYFIDFGLSMIVDDIVCGKYDKQLRVTVDYRAPEILIGGRIYNAAVDVWAFGIMVLSVMVSRDVFDVNFDTISDTNFHQVITNMFSNPTIIRNFLKGIRPKYYEDCVDFFTKILKINANERLTASQICDHPLFKEFSDKGITGSIEIPSILHDYADDHRDILKLIIYWAETLYATSLIELLFLAIDLFNRVDSFYKNHQSIDRMTLAATCLWVAAKLTNDKLISLDVYVPKIIETIENITINNILETEINIIHFLNGILHVSNLYKLCSNGDELQLSFEHIIMSKDSTLYARTDVPEWIRSIKSLVGLPRIPHKNISICDFLG